MRSSKLETLDQAFFAAFSPSFATLSKLDLSNNELRRVAPEIGLMANLITLKLCYNRLQELPNELGALSKAFHRAHASHNPHASTCNAVRRALSSCS
jgi:Leucine-rich repeat (LRR) protein